MLTPTMTAAMPTMIPSMVRKERRMFRRTARSAVVKIAHMKLSQLHGALLFLELRQGFRRMKALRHGFIGPDHAIAHHHLPLSEVRYVQFVSNHDDCYALLVQGLENAHD